MNSQANLKKISGLLAVAAIVVLVVHLASLALFNRHVFEVHGNDADSPTYMEIAGREDSTSTWLKRGYDLFGKTVDLTGATIDGTLHNNSSDTVESWTLRINIMGDCLINQAWNGEVEIHQHTGTAEERVQRLNLQDYELSDVKLEYLYDGDLLIPLGKGDYVLYFPNEKFKEQPLAGNDSIKIGVIFYYLDAIDLSNYDLEFQYHRSFTQGPAFVIFMLLLVLSIMFFLMYKAGDLAYKRAQTEMEIRKSGISSMSDIYAAIYIVELATGVMTPVSVDKKLERSHPWTAGAEKFLGKIAADAEEPYRDIVADFIRIDTLAGRLEERNSVLCEYVSQTYGWSSMRFFAMERIKGRPLERVIFTVQDVNEEKAELNRVEERINRAESESRAKGIFLSNMSKEIQAPIHAMLDLGARIAEESGEERVREDARRLCGAGDGLLSFVDGILDYSKLEAGELRLEPTDYSLRRLVAEVAEGMEPLMKERGLALEAGVSDSLPDALHGDALRLKQVIGNLLYNGAEALDSGGLSLSIFGKDLGGRVHLLVSVKASEEGSEEDGGTLSDERRAWHATGADGTGAGVGMSLASGLLALMGSEVKLVQSGGAWHECYFEVEQGVAGE